MIREHDDSKRRSPKGKGERLTETLSTKERGRKKMSTPARTKVNAADLDISEYALKSLCYAMMAAMERWQEIEEKGTDEGYIGHDSRDTYGLCAYKRKSAHVERGTI